METIPLTRGKAALVDDSDYPRLSQFKWYARKDEGRFYACRAVTVSPNKQKLIQMHREIIGGTLKIDHRDGNGLNNQRYNLRPATTSQNGQNRRKFAPASSPYKGVCFSKRDTKWLSRIAVNGRRVLLGYFLSEQDAARAYNDAAKKYFGEFANLNLIP